MAFEVVADSIEFAKEMALALALQNDLPDERMIRETVNVVNQHLFGTAQNERAIIKAFEAYLIPAYEPELETYD